MLSEQTRNAIIEMAMAGKPPRTIFQELNRTVSIGVIYKTLDQEKRRGLNVMDFRFSERLMQEFLTKQVLEHYTEPARERRCSVVELARRVLMTVGREDLFDAVLDDRKQPRRGVLPKR